MNPSQVKEYEQMYLNKGYSQQQIDLIKNRYGNQFRSPYKPYSQITDTMQFWESDQVEPIFPDSSSDSISLEKEKKDEKIKLAETDTTEELPYFGYSLFKRTPDAFKPNAIGPVDPGYLVGPGDILRLSVWGQVEFQ
ncbi:MAG: hypothetical protein GX640_16530, partial [Fibrobacter sp.]|nr:hypothetical protein [Fibrobacter sp.]